MSPIDLFVAYVMLSSVLAWVPVLLGPSALIWQAWRCRREVAVADHEALELLAGRALPGAGNGSRAALASLDEASKQPQAVRLSRLC